MATNMEALLGRIERLEKTLQSLQSKFEYPEATHSASMQDCKIDSIDKHGNIISQDKSTDLGVFTLPDRRRVKVLLDAICKNYNSQWPNYDHTCAFSGIFSSFNYDNGDPILWSLLEVGVRDSCEIIYEDRSCWYWRAQNSSQVLFDTSRQSGHRKWAAWARFRLDDGSGINITRLTCNC